MESYNKNILIIDDKIQELEDEVVQPLKRLGFFVERQSNPESGLILASHYYSIVFIDYKFDNSTKHTGTSLCYKIREACPLSTIILLTAYGKENIGNFAHADWDGYFEKGKKGVKARDLDTIIQDCLTMAIKVRENKYPILGKIPSETQAIIDKKAILDKLEELYRDKPFANLWEDKAVALNIGYNSREALSGKFTCQTKGTKSLIKEALIFRHLLMTNPDTWLLARKHYGPLRNLEIFFFGNK